MRISAIKPDHELNFVTLVGGESEGVKGRCTMPAQRVYDPERRCKEYFKTDLAETFARARQQLRGDRL